MVKFFFKNKKVYKGGLNIKAVNYDEVIRITQSVCPVCVRNLPAKVVRQNNKIYLVKSCPKHGKFSLLISKNGHLYKQLNDLYFSLFPGSLLQKDYIVHITNKCNLNCSICLANSNAEGEQAEYPIEKLRQFLKVKKNYKIDLMGTEPTMRKDLAQIIEMVKQSGNITALHTNGIKLADYQYLRELKQAGLDEVHFQFDSFKDSFYENIRGQRLLNTKLKALDNLEKFGIATDLKMTIVRGLNDDELMDVLQFGIKRDFVKEVFFLGCRFLGRAKHKIINNCMMPDELLDNFVNQCDGRINYEDFLTFHRLYYRILKLFSIRKCFYNRHLLLVRNRNGTDYIPITRLLGLKNYFKNQRAKVLNINLELVKELAYNCIRGNFLKPFKLFKTFRLSDIPKPFLLLGFISACDGYSFDYQIAKNCGKGAISPYRGVEPCGALDNVKRDYKFDLR